MQEEEKYSDHRMSKIISKNWVVPSTLIIGIDVSILLFILEYSKLLTILLMITGITVILSIFCLIFNLIWWLALSQINEDADSDTIELIDKMHLNTWLIGLFSFLLSISFLCFTKSIILGIVSILFTLLLLLIYKGLIKELLDIRHTQKR